MRPPPSLPRFSLQCIIILPNEGSADKHTLLATRRKSFAS